MREVIDQLWIGNAIDARDVTGVLGLGVAAIVDLAIEEPPIQYPRDVVYCRFPLIDGSGNQPAVLRVPSKRRPRSSLRERLTSSVVSLSRLATSGVFPIVEIWAWLLYENGGDEAWEQRCLKHCWSGLKPARPSRRYAWMSSAATNLRLGCTRSWGSLKKDGGPGISSVVLTITLIQ